MVTPVGSHLLQKEVKRKMKTYETQFLAQDKLSQNKASAELIEKRRKMAEEFAQYRERKQREVTDRADVMRDMRPGKISPCRTSTLRVLRPAR